MNPVLLLGLLQAVLSVVVSQTASTTEKQRVLEILAGLSGLLESGTEINAALAKLTQEINAMVGENRDPTKAEVDALKSASDTAHETIQTGKVPEIEEPPPVQE